jgi:hypothetical protein
MSMGIEGDIHMLHVIREGYKAIFTMFDLLRLFHRFPRTLIYVHSQGGSESSNVNYEWLSRVNAAAR